MRRLFAFSGLVCVLSWVAGCTPSLAAPRTSGALWALDEARLEEEMVYRTPEPRRAAQARQFELQVSQDALAAEAGRLQALLTGCPGGRQASLSPSPGAAARDAARSKQHPALSTRAAQLASADWYLRRAATTSQPSFCERARQMLTDTQSDQPQSDHELLALLQDLPPGRVAADPSAASIEGIDASSDLYQALAMYRLGLIDEVRGPALLVGHLAVVYGGALELPTSGLAVSLPPEEIVDRLAPGLGWEPDGLYAALRAVSRSA